VKLKFPREMLQKWIEFKYKFRSVFTNKKRGEARSHSPFILGIRTKNYN